MRSLTIMLPVVALVLLGGPAVGFAADDDLPELPGTGKLERKPRRGGKVERPGVIALSDGTRVGGMLSFSTGRELKLFDEARQRWITADLREIERLTFEVEYEKEIEVWRWKESGKDEKVYTGETYIDRRYRATLEKTRGQENAGHVLGTVIYLRDDEGEKQKFFLRKDQRGEIGQDAEALVFVESIDLRRDALEKWRRAEEARRKAEEAAERKKADAETDDAESESEDSKEATEEQESKTGDETGEEQ
jgi:hypothetical protein